MFTNRSLEAVSFNSQLSTTKYVPKISYSFIYMIKIFFIRFNCLIFGRSHQSTNVQTTEIVYNQNPVQTVETRTVEVFVNIS